MNLGVDREVVVSDRTDKEGAVEGDRPGVIRLVSERTGCRGRNRVGCVVPVVGLVVVSGHVVVPGHTSSNVGPVVAGIRDIRVKPVLGVTRAISDGTLVRIRGVVVGHSTDDTEVRVVRDDGGAIRTGVIQNGLANSTFGAIESNAVGTGCFKGGICPGRGLKITHPGKGNEGCKDARNHRIARRLSTLRTTLYMLRLGGNSEPIHVSPYQGSHTILTVLIDIANM